MHIGYTMTILNCTLLNFAHADILAPIFENYSNDFEYTTNDTPQTEYSGELCHQTVRNAGIR
jgi:hypothetical protein